MTGLEFRTILAGGTIGLLILLIIPAFGLSLLSRLVEEDRDSPNATLLELLILVFTGALLQYVFYVWAFWNDNQHIVYLLVMPTVPAFLAMVHVLTVIALAKVLFPHRGVRSVELYFGTWIVGGLFWWGVLSFGKDHLIPFKDGSADYRSDISQPKPVLPSPVANPAPTAGGSSNRQLDAEISRLERLYPQIAPGQLGYDQAMVDRIIARREVLERSGLDPVTATRQAVADLLEPQYGETPSR